MFASSTSSAPFRVGMLGHGTVGSAFAEPLDKQAAELVR
jgi:homoserine dehydrogenase